MHSFDKPKQSWLERLINLPLRHLQQAVGSLGDIWRTPFASLMTILVLGISLTLPATMQLFVKNTKAITAQWSSASEITLFAKLNASDAQLQSLVKRIQLYSEVDKVRFISNEQALTDFKKISGFGKSLDYLTENPLPATIFVTPTKRASQANAAQALLEKLLNEPEVAQGKLDLEWLTRLQAMANLISDIVLSIALLLCLSVVLIIGNTIRLSILSQKEAIGVMKLVGATDDFIQRPFLYTGMWYGVFGGVIAIILVTILAQFLSLSVTELSALYQHKFHLQGLSISESLALILVAILLGLLGSYLSVRQHIRAIEPVAD